MDKAQALRMLLLLLLSSRTTLRLPLLHSFQLSWNLKLPSSKMPTFGWNFARGSRITRKEEFPLSIPISRGSLGILSLSKITHLLGKLTNIFLLLQSIIKFIMYHNTVINFSKNAFVCNNILASSKQYQEKENSILNQTLTRDLKFQDRSFVESVMPFLKLVPNEPRVLCKIFSGIWQFKCW